MDPHTSHSQRLVQVPFAGYDRAIPLAMEALDIAPLLARQKTIRFIRF